MTNIGKVPTIENRADIGIKILTLSKFKYCLELLGVSNG